MSYTNRILSYDVLDGDTVRCVLDLHDGITLRLDIRLLGCNAPECSHHAGDHRQWAAGDAVKAWVARELAKRPLQMLLCLAIRPDKFNGRYDGTIFSQGWDLSGSLTSRGLAKKWDGKGPKPTWTQEELDAVVAKCKETP